MRPNAREFSTASHCVDRNTSFEPTWREPGMANQPRQAARAVSVPRLRTPDIIRKRMGLPKFGYYAGGSRIISGGTGRRRRATIARGVCIRPPDGRPAIKDDASTTGRYPVAMRPAGPTRVDYSTSGGPLLSSGEMRTRVGRVECCAWRALSTVDPRLRATQTALCASRLLHRGMWIAGRRSG